MKGPQGDREFIENPCVKRILENKPRRSKDKFSTISRAKKLISILAIALITQNALLTQYQRDIEQQQASQYKEIIDRLTLQRDKNTNNASYTIAPYSIIDEIPDCGDRLIMQLGGHLTCS